MRAGRWYPTSTELADGSIVITAGKDENAIAARTPEVWTAAAAWRALTGATANLPYYPRQFLAPNGKLFYAASSRRASTQYVRLGQLDAVGDRHYGVRDYGAAVMYLPGKILYVGGGRTTATAETIDLNLAAPVWKWTGSMAYPRRHLNATVLPTGEVLVTSGTRGTSFDEPSLAVHVAEIWNPTTGVWARWRATA